MCQKFALHVVSLIKHFSPSSSLKLKWTRSQKLEVLSYILLIQTIPHIWMFDFVGFDFNVASSEPF